MELRKKIFSVSLSDDYRHKILNLLGIKIKTSTKQKITNKDRKEYVDYVLNHSLDKSKFVPETDKPYNGNAPVKLVSWYLPQYHDFDVNLKWFGRGFSEWSNTSKAVPQFTGHWQPHVPIDVGFYNLETPAIMKRQIELAKKYGVYGFGFYYYWFSGQKVMEKPLENFLKDKSLDMPFFLFWANENWTRLWGGGGLHEVLFEQKLLDDDDEKFMADALPYMKDDRYIKIDNKPVLVIYQPNIFDNKKYLRFVERINEIARENGFDGIYLMATFTRDFNNCLEEYRTKHNMDAIFEFIPRGFTNKIGVTFKKIMNNNFKGIVYDIDTWIKEKKYFYKTDCKKLFKGVFPNWDNTARKCDIGCFIIQNTVENYKTWLKDIINWTKENHKESERFVFINAWNEWAEGAHLEPDQKHGYAYLQATKEALEECE